MNMNVLQNDQNLVLKIQSTHTVFTNMLLDDNPLYFLPPNRANSVEKGITTLEHLEEKGGPVK